MGFTDIKQLLPRDYYQAIIGAASPSSTNVFATMNDVTTPSLSAVLINGNITGANDIIISDTQVIKAASGGGELNLRAGANDKVILSNDNGALAKEILWMENDFIGLYVDSGFTNSFEIWKDPIPADSYMKLYAEGKLMIRSGGSGGIANLISPTFAQTYTFTFPSATGTLALTSDITNAVSGTLNTIAMFTPDGSTVGDSPITFDGLAEVKVTVPGGFFNVVNNANNKIVLNPQNNTIEFQTTAVITGYLSANSITASRTWTLPDATGTLALTSDIPAPDGNGIYTGNGSLSGNTVVTMGGSSLSFNGGMVAISEHVNQGISAVVASAKFHYMAASATADTIGDTRFYSTYTGGVSTFIIEKCTVANVTKGAGTWVNINSFSL